MYKIINREDNAVYIRVRRVDFWNGDIVAVFPDGQRAVFPTSEWRWMQLDERTGYPAEVCDWLREKVRKKGYSACGISAAVGMSHSWLSMVLRGERKILPKHREALEKELGLEAGAIERKLKKTIQ